MMENNKPKNNLTFFQRLDVVRKTINFPKFGISLIVFFSGIFVLLEFINYLPIIKTFTPGAYALAAWMLLMGFVATLALLIDTSLVWIPPIILIFYPVKK